MAMIKIHDPEGDIIYRKEGTGINISQMFIEALKKFPVGSLVLYWPDPGPGGEKRDPYRRPITQSDKKGGSSA